MNSGGFDFPESLWPTTFLQDVTMDWKPPVRQVVGRCIEAARGEQRTRVEAMVREADALWLTHGDEAGRAVALLWLADWYLRHGETGAVLQNCEKALEHFPSGGPPPHYPIIKAVAHYMLGLVHHGLEAQAEAFRSYQEAGQQFQIAQAYWRRIGDNERAGAYGQLLAWLEGLSARLASSAVPSQTPTPSPPPPSPLPSSGQDWAELTQLPVLQEPIPAGAPRDLSGLAHDNAVVRHIFIQDQPYEIRSLRRDKRVLFTSGRSYVIIPVKGDSMNLKQIGEGDYVVVRLLKDKAMPVNQEIVAAELVGEEEVTLKQYIVTGGRRYLQAASSNPQWHDYNVEIDENIVLRGVVVAVLKPVRSAPQM